MSSIINPWTTLSTELKYENAWLKVTESAVLNPNGNPGIYGVVHFKNIAIGIIPLDETYHTWIVGQFRYTLNEYSWEIPEGGGKPTVENLLSAQRELLEETGITAKRWTEVMKIHTSNSVTDEVGYAFVAQELSFGESMPEDTEDLSVQKLPFSELVEMVMRGEITDAFSVAAILKVDKMIAQGLL